MTQQSDQFDLTTAYFAQQRQLLAVEEESADLVATLRQRTHVLNAEVRIRDEQNAHLTRRAAELEEQVGQLTDQVALRDTEIVKLNDLLNPVQSPSEPSTTEDPTGETPGGQKPDDAAPDAT